MTALVLRRHRDNRLDDNDFPINRRLCSCQGGRVGETAPPALVSPDPAWCGVSGTGAHTPHVQSHEQPRVQSHVWRHGLYSVRSHTQAPCHIIYLNYLSYHYNVMFCAMDSVMKSHATLYSAKYCFKCHAQHSSCLHRLKKVSNSWWREIISPPGEFSRYQTPAVT